MKNILLLIALLLTTSMACSFVNTIVRSGSNAQDEQMVFVPAGDFLMGSDNGNDDEKPIHLVYLDAFYVDKYEVTNALYKACVNAEVCTPPTYTTSTTRSSYYSNSKFDNYPVVFVDWYMAKTYCEWRGARLPTEAEWEKAARGTDERIYPWGNNIDCTYANYGPDFSGPNQYCIGDTSAVGSYEKGKSPYGLYDMAGNVQEWVADWFDVNYYSNSPSSNPQGPTNGETRVRRGGSWVVGDDNATVTFRNWNYPTDERYFLGFRCARDLTP